MTKVILSNWFVALVGSLLYLGTTLFCFSTARIAVVPPEDDGEEEKTLVSESWAFINPDLDQIITELKREREALAAREQQLMDLERRLSSERQEIRVAADGVERIQRELNETIVRIQREEIPNLKKVAKIHTAMSPEGSAAILSEQTDDEILKILFYIKPSEAGPIMEAFGRLGKSNAQRAGQLTERLRRSLEILTKDGKS